MAARTQSRFWRTLRLVWRGCRIVGLLLVLVAIVSLIYLNRHGLPEFAKRSLLEKLRARGLDLEMSVIRLSLHRGLVAEDVKFGRAANPAGYRLTARTVEVNLSYLSLLKRRLQVTAVVLDQGRFAWPVAETNAPARELILENIRANLRLPPGDEWALDRFQASFAGVDLALSGNVTNASAIRDWPMLHGQRLTGTTQRRLRFYADTLERIRFSARPELRLVVSGDARDPQSFTARLALKTPDAETPWGRITRGLFTARLFAATNGGLAHVELNLQADDAKTTWANVNNLNLTVELYSPAGQSNLVDVTLFAKASQVGTRWVSTTETDFTAHWIHSLTNAIPLSGYGELRADSGTANGLSSKTVFVTARLATPANPPPLDESWGWWANLHPYHLDWRGELSAFQSAQLAADKVVCQGRWRSPELIITNLHAHFSDGDLTARAQLDVATREAAFDLTSDFDLQKLSPFLAPNSRRWLERLSWSQPPVLAARGAVTMPAWTNRQPDWRGSVLPTLRLAGEIAVTNAAYLGFLADWMHSHVSCSNQVWRLPDLEARLPGGDLKLEHITDTRTQDYLWRVHSAFDLRSLRPLLTPSQQRGLDLVGFSQPPVIDGEVRGRWAQYDRTSFQGRVSLTNFSFRGETADHVETALRYTNRVIELFDPRLQRGTQTLAAAGITVDLNTFRIHFTNGFSTTEPHVVARAIGPQPAHTLEPYRFGRPPTVRVQGYVSLRGSSDADLTFNLISGSDFQWWKFKVPQVAGEIRWLGETVILTNVYTSFYGGDAAGFAFLDCSAKRGTDFTFTWGITNASLPRLLADLSPRSNHLEGALSGSLTITRANSEDPQSWTGSGRARLRDGLLWEIPIFGVLSKPLDTIMPGVGSSRVSEASARFALTSGVIAWDKLEMRAPTMRLQYDGTVNLDGRVDMRVEAEPLRDTPLFGRILSYALWPVTKLFQYRITGTLDNPKSEPVYVPKLLMMPLHPFRTLEELLNSDSEKTNAPPVFKEVPE